MWPVCHQQCMQAIELCAKYARPTSCRPCSSLRCHGRISSSSATTTYTMSPPSTTTTTTATAAAAAINRPGCRRGRTCHAAVPTLHRGPRPPLAQDAEPPEAQQAPPLRPHPGRTPRGQEGADRRIGQGGTTTSTSICPTFLRSLANHRLRSAVSVFFGRVFLFGGGLI